MRILIEEYRYKADDVRETIHGIDVLEDIDGYVSVNYVGCYFNSHPDVYDCVLKLREAGHDVYDFRNPPSGDLGFKWNCVSGVCLMQQ